MRVLFVVQRYGEDVAGGAEAHCRLFAERMATRGHQVTVVTSAARDYDTWSDHYPPGTTVEHGVRVRRLPVTRPRDVHRFAEISGRTVGRPDAGPVTQSAWMLEQGPVLRRYADVLLAEAVAHDAVVFFTYLYATTAFGVPVVAPHRPTVLHPTAHDEAPLRLPVLRRTFDQVTALACSTPEELELVRHRFRSPARHEVIGIGFDPPSDEPDAAGFREAFGLRDRPFLLYLGRIDPNKGADEAIAFVRRYRSRRDTDLALVMVGANAMGVTPTEDVILTGFVPDSVRWSALEGCTALVQPSYQESFSMALAEAWLARRPALVQGHCDVLDGLARRAGGALPYRDYPEFEAALDLLLDRPELRAALSHNGHAHVVEHFGWDTVLDRYEALLDTARVRWADRRDQSSARRATTA